MAHILGRITPPPAAAPLRVLIHARDARKLAWVEEEHAGLSVVVQIARSMDETVAALVDDPPPRPTLLVADFDSLSVAELLQLHVVRERGWFGSVFAIGKVSLALRRSLGIDRVFGIPLQKHALRSALGTLGSHDGATMRIARIVTG